MANKTKTIKTMVGLISPLALLVTSGTAVAAAPSPAFAAASNLSSNPLVKDIQSIVDFLSIGVGVIVIGALIYGGIQYIAAGDNPQAVSAAKSRIVNALIGLIAFMLLFAFIQWVIPGGAFSS